MPMRLSLLLLVFVVFARISVAVEFDTRLTVQGEGFASPVAPFFESSNGNLELAAATDSFLFRYALNSDGTMQRTALTPAFRDGQIRTFFSLGADLVEVTTTNSVGFFGFPPIGYLRRYGADGALKFSRQVADSGGFGRVPAFKADGLGGFWISSVGLLHADISGNITRISRTRGSRGFFVGEYLIEFGAGAIYRTPISLTPIAHQTTPLPAGLLPVCLIANGTQGMSGLSTSYDSPTGQYSIRRSEFSSAGFLLNTSTLIESIASLPEIRCEPTRVALLTSYSAPSVIPRELTMLDSSLAIQWQVPIPRSVFHRLIAIGRNGEALLQLVESTSQTTSHLHRFSAQGSLTIMPNVGASSAAFDISSALYLTRKQQLSDGARLQVAKFANNNLTTDPTLVYDLNAPIGAPVPLAAALENNAVRLLSRNPEVSLSQHLLVDINGRLQLQFERTDPISQAQRFANGWLTQTVDRAGAAVLQLRNDNGNPIFSSPIASKLLTCEADNCDFLGSAGMGKIDRVGVVSGYNPLFSTGDQLHSAPQQRASVLFQQKITRLINNQPVSGSVVVDANSDIVQNTDGTHWIVQNQRAVFADFLGVSLSAYTCPLATTCSVMLDQAAKRVFVISSQDESISREIRELTRSVALGQPTRLALPNDMEGYFVHAVSSAGNLIWTRATIQLRNSPAIESLLAIDTSTGSQQQWVLAPSAVVQHSLSGMKLQFVAADRSLTTIEKITSPTGDQLSVRRFEFNPIDESFADGFEALTVWR